MDQTLFQAFGLDITSALLLEIVFTALSVIGLELNVRRRPASFVFWGLSNMVAMSLFAFQGKWVLVALYAYLLTSCIRGVRAWRSASGAKPGAQGRDCAPVGSA